jgi:phage shock protein A
MQEELVQLRQAVAQSMAALKRQELQYNRSQVQLEEYDRQPLQALQNGDQNLANENLSQKQKYVSLAETLRSKLDLQSRQVHTLMKDLLAIEVKIFKAKSELSRERLITCFTTSKPEIIGKVDEELAALKAKIMADSLAHQIVLPPSDAAK